MEFHLIYNHPRTKYPVETPIRLKIPLTSILSADGWPNFLQHRWQSYFFPARLKLFPPFFISAQQLSWFFNISRSFFLLLTMKYSTFTPSTIATFTCSVGFRKCPLKFPFLHPEQESFVINVSNSEGLSQPQELSQKGAFNACINSQLFVGVAKGLNWMSLDVNWLPIKLSLQCLLSSLFSILTQFQWRCAAVNTRQRHQLYGAISIVESEKSVELRIFKEDAWTARY